MEIVDFNACIQIRFQGNTIVTEWTIEHKEKLKEWVQEIQKTLEELGEEQKRYNRINMILYFLLFFSSTLNSIFLSTSLADLFPQVCLGFSFIVFFILLIKILFHTNKKEYILTEKIERFTFLIENIQYILTLSPKPENIKENNIDYLPDVNIYFYQVMKAMEQMESLQ